jgi:Flp pilus assembly protein TadD
VCGAALVVLVASAAAAAEPTAPRPCPQGQTILARATQLHQSGAMDQAIDAYKRYLSVCPNEAGVLSNLGAAYARAGRYDDAIAQYELALVADGANAAIHMNLAIALYKAERLGAAIRELAKVRELQPQNRDALMLLADCHLQLGDNREVIELVAPLAGESPDNLALAYLLGTALIREKQYEKGAAFIDRILRQQDSAEAHVLMGEAHQGAHDSLRAVQEFARAAALKPDLPGVHTLHGLALLAIDDRAAAEDAFRRALARDPNDFEATRQLGILAKLSGRDAEAREHFQHALRLRSGALDVDHEMASPPVVTLGQNPTNRDLSGHTDLKESGYLIKSGLRAVSAQKAALQDSDLVIGVVIGNEARAYPVNPMLGPVNEVLNDTLGGTPVSVTWCPVAHAAVVYDPRLQGRRLELGAVGLQNGVFVLYDRQTGSWWSQIRGTAIRGAMEGRELRRWPSVLTTWASWQRLHPGTTVNTEPTLSAVRRFTQETWSWMTVVPGGGAIVNKDLVAGVLGFTRARAWLLRRLYAAGRVVNDTLDGEPLVIFLDADAVTVRILRRTVAKRALTFRAEGDSLRDEETGSAWDPLSGHAVSGPLAGTKLESVVFTTALWYAWKSQQPDTTLWDGPAS